MRRNIFSNLTLVFSVAGVILLLLPFAAFAQDETVRTPEEILAQAGETPTADAIRELFINCSAWDEAHQDVQESSKQALIDLGAITVPTLLEYLPSTNVQKRVTLDEIIAAIGNPAAQYLIPYLQDADSETRRHAATLLGETAFINKIEDKSVPGPSPEDRAAIDALTAALEVETDWHAKASVIGSLGKMRDPGQIALLSEYLADEEQALRLAAAVALGRIPDQEAVMPLIRAFSDPLMNVRQAAVLALGMQAMGNLAFEALAGAVSLPPSGMTGRLCALEALTRYLQAVASDDTNRTTEQRTRAFSLASGLLSTGSDSAEWQVRGYACALLGYTYDEKAMSLLDEVALGEQHPFVLGKIEEAREVLQEGKPVESKNQ
jgi:HEAT repeat protein